MPKYIEPRKTLRYLSLAALREVNLVVGANEPMRDEGGISARFSLRPR